MPSGTKYKLSVETSEVEEAAAIDGGPLPYPVAHHSPLLLTRGSPGCFLSQ